MRKFIEGIRTKLILKNKYSGIYTGSFLYKSDEIIIPFEIMKVNRDVVVICLSSRAKIYRHASFWNTVLSGNTLTDNTEPEDQFYFV